MDGQFYIGKKDTLYFRRENGSLSRFGIRFAEDGIYVFDQLTREWYELPNSIEVNSGGRLVIEANMEAG